jgi:NAD(P)-dependent dehydrogenase (short-subunit alcohol dehydrogenase family)
LLGNFVTPIRAVVVGASGGIGGAFLRALEADPAVASVEAAARGRIVAGTKTRAHALDLEDDASLDRFAAALADGPPVDLVLVATGALHGPALVPEKTWRQLERASLARSFMLNAIGPALLLPRLLPLMPRDRKAVFAALSARVGSIEDNRLGGWYAYRAAKAALNQLLRTAAIELTRRAPQGICVGLHPGTVDTRLSQPFQSSVNKEQLFRPDEAAARLLQVVDGLTAADTGGFFAWDGTRLPF